MKIKTEIIRQHKRWTRAIPSYRQVIKECIEASINASYLSSTKFPYKILKVTVVLAEDSMLYEYNKKYRDQDKPTNVLSFPMFNLSYKAPELIKEIDDNMIGDILISLDTIEREATFEKKPLVKHFAHMIIHGTLHLLGYDHMNDEDAEVMEGLEEKILRNL